MKKTAFLLLVLLSSATIFAQKNKKNTPAKDPKKWDVSNPPGNYKDLEFTVTEGTWMSLDVSPDGKELVFDLLGDIYLMPVSGGEARLLRGGLALELQPRFSPDGSRISFTSDAGGGDNIWTMKKDGSDAKQVTKEDFRLLNNAVWSADGNYLIARKHFTSTRSLGAGELWMYHFTGGEGIQLTKRKNDQQDLGEPCVSADGKYIYFSEDMYPGGYFQYNKDPNNQVYVIQRYNIEKGSIEYVTGGGGGAQRPQISKDGKTLAFVRRVGVKTVLYLRNMESGEEWPVFDQLSKDQQEAWAIFGVYPNFSWLDSEHIVIYANGKIWNLNISDAKATEIPFKALCKHKIREALKFENAVAPDKFTAKMIRGAVTSPDEKYIVFSAVGNLWKKELPNGTPVPLSFSNPAYKVMPSFASEPSFSPDGKELVYVSWNDVSTGAVVKADLVSNSYTLLTTEKGIYRSPRFSPDGKTIVYWKEEGNDAQGFAYSLKPGIYTVAASGGSTKLVSEEGAYPVFSADGKRIFYEGGEEGQNAFKSCDLNGNEKRTHFVSKYTNGFYLSPDNKWIAYKELFKVYIAAFPASGQTLDLSGNMGAVPSAQVARDAGINVHWSSDGSKLHWTLGEEYFTNDLRNRFSFLPGASEKILPMDSVGIKINLVLNSDKPTQVLALKNARLITMKGDEVIENGTIIITDNKITDIGKSGEVKIPTGAREIDYNGKTIMPGIVDVHAHLGTFRQGLSPQKQWQYYANLAYGVTTTHDPSSNTEMVFSQSEMVKFGSMVGPRIFSTGWILYGADGDFKAVINNLDDARSAITRTKAFGAFSVKSYNQPRRNQRQQVIEAAFQQKVMVYPEGGSTTWHNMTQIMDGHTGIEHNLPVAPLHDDFIKLWGASKTGYTPTLIVCYGAMNGENYWYQKSDVWTKSRLMKFTPRFVIDSKARHRVMSPDEEYENGHVLVAKSCKKLLDAGVCVNLGAHGQLQGLGAHWELWLLQSGGMTNMEALRCATLNGAKYLGMDKEIGSLEKGKLADLIIMDKNPLENIYNSESVRYTMVNGKLYDCETMNEVLNADKVRSSFYFEGKYAAPFNWHEAGAGHVDGD